MPKVNKQDIQTASPFKDIFRIDPSLLNTIINDMVKNGYDEAHPLILWEGKEILIDGHTRLEAVKATGISEVPVVYKIFHSVEDALKYAITCQKNRRNLTQAEIMACIVEVDKLKTAGRPAENKLAPSGANYGKSAAETAETVGVSTRTVERARAVIDKATPEIKEAVKSGEMSINAAYNATVAAKEPKEQIHQSTMKLTYGETIKIELALEFIRSLDMSKPQIKILCKTLMGDEE